MPDRSENYFCPFCKNRLITHFSVTQRISVRAETQVKSGFIKEPWPFVILEFFTFRRKRWVFNNIKSAYTALLPAWVTCTAALRRGKTLESHLCRKGVALAPLQPLFPADCETVAILGLGYPFCRVPLHSFPKRWNFILEGLLSFHWAVIPNDGQVHLNNHYFVMSVCVKEKNQTRSLFKTL